MTNSKINQVTSLLFKTTRLIQEHLRPAKKTDPATFLRMGTLHYIFEHGHPTMQEISKFLFITPPSVTPLINGLIKTKMISRISDDKDRRIVRLSITSQGKKTLEKACREMTSRMSEVLKKLDTKDHDDLIRIIQKLNQTYKI
ncbi:MAG: MarR family transcriptional regulator [Patescibacteria group bacterium]